MKILVDEHIPLMTVQALPTMGYDVRDIRGTPDEGYEAEFFTKGYRNDSYICSTPNFGYWSICLRG